MAEDAALRRCLVWLAVVIVVVGIYTHSFKKMMVTYFVGLAGIAGVLLPDWDFFDREIVKWTQPVSVDEIKREDVLRTGSTRTADWIANYGVNLVDGLEEFTVMPRELWRIAMEDLSEVARPRLVPST